MSKKPDLGDYIDVAARIAEFRARYPDGSLQPWDIASPYRVESIGQETYIVVVAAAYRTGDDPRPGVGMAYEVFPGRTPYTKGSELQNAETSAWGRAIVAALAADTKQIASAEEVRNRREEQAVTVSDVSAARIELSTYADRAGIPRETIAARWLAEKGHPLGEATDAEAIRFFTAQYQMRGAA